MRDWYIKLGMYLCFATAIVLGGMWLKAQASRETKPSAQTSSHVMPVLTVNVTQLKTNHWVKPLTLQGNIHPWQELVISSETSGLKLITMTANIGDYVRKGQVLVQYDTKMILNDIRSAQTQVNEAKVAFSEAYTNLKQASTLEGTDTLSEQQLRQYRTAVASSKSKLDNAEIQLEGYKIRLSQATIVAPDDGVITSRAVAVGSVTASGQELFKLIRKGRLEWRAEATAQDIALIKVGQKVNVMLDSGAAVEGEVRMLSPTIDTQNRVAIVYVDLPKHIELKAGLFVKGTIDLQKRPVNVLPLSAVQLKDGFYTVFEVSSDHKLIERKIEVGQIQSEQIEILSGVSANAKIVTDGIAFLKTGDTVVLYDAHRLMNAPSSNNVTKTEK